MAELHDAANALRQSHLQAFVSEFAEAVKKDGDLSFSSSRIEELRGKLQGETSVPMELVQQVVRAIEIDGVEVCERLDVQSFCLVVEILTKSPPFVAQERGLYLLMESLQDNASHSIADQVSETENGGTAAEERKGQLGTQLLIGLLKYFTDNRMQDRARRWTGLLISELVRNCESNQLLLNMAPEDLRRTLGSIITDEKSQVLKLVSGSIIREMLAAGSPIHTFWPLDILDDATSQFPESLVPASQWIGRFELFLDRLHTLKVLKDTNSDVFLAYAVAADHSHFEGEGAAIAVTVSDVLSIVVPATSTSPVQYIDISLEDISEVEIQKTMLQPKSSQSNHEPVEVTDLLVRLFSGQGKNYRLNAAFHHTKELHITYQHLEEAEDIASYIKEEQATRKEHSVVHSMAVDKLSVVPGELAISKPDAQARNGSQAPSIIADQGRVTVVSASQQITELSSKILQNSDRDTTTTSKISYSAPLATEAAIQLTGAEHGVGTLAATETLVEPLDRRNGLPKPELNSSDKWQEGKAIIEDAKEFRSPSAEPRVRTPSTDTHRSVSPSPAAILEDEGLYDVSPRGAKLQEVRRSSQQSDPVGFLRDDNHPDLGTATERKNVTNMPATQGRKLKDLLRDQDGRQSKEVLGKDLPLPRPDGMTSALTSNKRVRKKPSTYANPKPRTKVQYQSEKQDVNRIDTEGTENDAPDPDIYEFPSSEQQGPDPKSKRIPGKSASRAAAAKDKAQKTQTSSRSQALGRPSEIQVVKDAVASLPPPPAEETLGDTKGKVELRDPTNRDEVFKVKETKAVVVTRRPGQKRDSNAERSSAVKPDTVIASVETSAPIPPSAIKEHSSNLQTKAAKPTKPSKPTKPTKPKKPTKKQKPKVVISEPRSTRAAALKANQKILKLNLAEQGENGDIEVGANKHESPPPEQEPPATETVPPSEAVYKVPIVNLLAGSRGQRSRRRRVSSNVPEKEVNGLSIESNKADAVNSRQESTIHGSADPVPGSQGQASNKGRNQGGVEIPDSEEVSDSEEVNIVECPSPIEAEGAPSGPVNHHFDDAVLVMQDDGIEVPEVEAPREPVVAVLAAQNAQDYARGIKRQSMASKIKGSLASLSLAPDQDDHVQMPTSILKKRQDIKKELPTANNVPINRTSTRHSPVMEKRPIRTPTHAAIRHVTLPSGSEPAKRAAKHLHKSPSQIKSTKSVHMLQQTNDVTLRTSSSERHSHSQQSEVISISSNGSENDTYYTDEGDEEIEPLKIPQPENKSKRRADDIDLEHISKKAKANAESKKRASTPVAQRKASPDRQKVPTPVLVDDYLQRKAPIISFSAKGPRNQGVKLAKKTSKSPQDNIENNTETEKNLTFKRKREGGVDKWANAAAQTPLAKRRRASITVPHTREYVPELAPESSSPPITEVSHQQGSKKRVAENGSPIPTVQYLDLSKGPYERLHDLFVNGDGHLGDDESVSFGDHLAEDDILLPRDGLPVPRNEEPQRTDPEEMILSSNRKPPPDSPSAPSKTLAAFSAHRVQSGGKFVNVKTAKVVKTAEPQDPFISVKPVRSSSFLEKLRAKNNLGNNEVLSRSKDVPQLPPVQPQEEDPDKTLVDDLPGESDVLSPPSEIASATSKSSRSTSTARHTDESRAESEPDLEREWREALKPHQRNMLDILYQISNRLVRHLVDKETATEDIIHDYERGGMRLIEELERAHQTEYARFQRDIDTAKTELKAEYKSTMEYIIEGNRDIRQQPVAALYKEHIDQQQQLNEMLEAAYRALD